MTAFAISDAAALLGVSVDTVRRWADSGRIPTSRDSAGRRRIDGAALAAFAAANAANTAVALTSRESARNHFTGLVTRVVKDTVMAQVELQSGPHRIVSLISREAVDELGLEPGVLAVASVKATNVVIELPAGA